MPPGRAAARRPLGAALVALASLLGAACHDAPPRPDRSVAIVGSLQKRLEMTADPAERVTLRIQIATTPIVGAADRDDWQDRVEQAVTDLRALLAEVAGDPDAEPRVRLALGEHLSKARDHAAAEEELRRVLETAPDTPYAPAAMEKLADDLWRRDDRPGCKAILEALIRAYPDSPEARRAPTGIHNCDAPKTSE